MTCLEHLIENCLCKFEDGKPYEEIERTIENDINLADSGITAEQCFEICLYVWDAFIRYGGYKKINDGDIIIHKDEKERTDEETKWLVEHNAEVRKRHEKFLEDSGNIILTKEDMQKYAKDCLIGEVVGLDILNGEIARGERKAKEARKETAREILTKIRKEFKKAGILLDFSIIAKQYGVEVEE